MLRNNQDGITQPLAIPFMIVVFLLVVMTGLSVWSYSQYTDQRDNVNVKVADAVADAGDELRQELQKEFDEQEKSPLKTYQGSAALGSITVKYPKTWSAYVEEKETGAVGIDGYFHPVYVPDVGASSDTAFALRLELTNASYSRELAGYQRRVEKKEATSRPVNISGVEGVRLDGMYDTKQEGAIIILPLRDKTLKIYTESTDFVKDFNEKIVKNLKFIP